MNRTELTFLQAEKNSLLQLIEETPNDAVITLGSLQARLEEVESYLEKYSTQQPSFEGRITFRGKPVLGSHAIDSAFTSKILDVFSLMIAAKASSYQGELNSSGKIANRDAYRLNITGTTSGSFGFVLEENPTDQERMNGVPSPVESAISDCIEFFNVLQNHDEEELANVIDQTDNRVLDYIRTFMDNLIASEATCALESGVHSFRFNSTQEILKFSQKITEDNIREWEESYIGQLKGVMLSERKFEFFPTDHQPPILKGKIPIEIDNVEEIGQNYSYANQPLRIHVLAKQVGNGPIRYSLKSYDLIQ